MRWFLFAGFYCTKTEKIPNVTSKFLSHVRTRLLNMTWSNLRFNIWRSFVTMATNLPFCFFIQFLEQLLKFLANFTLLKYVKSQGSYGFLITKELIFGFQILDLEVHFTPTLVKRLSCVTTTWGLKVHSQGQQTIRVYWVTVILTLPFSEKGGWLTVILNMVFRRVGWQKFETLPWKSRGGREGGKCEVLRPCHPPPKKFGTCTNTMLCMFFRISTIFYEESLII